MDLLPFVISSPFRHNRAMVSKDGHDPLQPHSHDPNPEPPGENASFTLIRPGQAPIPITVAQLQALPSTAVDDCYIVSTGHGTSGPFTFGGVTLFEFVQQHVPGPWSQVEVISGDGFGTRVQREELLDPNPAGPLLLAHTIDGRPLTREEGLVRLIDPGETDDALRQVKWIGQINVLP